MCQLVKKVKNFTFRQVPIFEKCLFQLHQIFWLLINIHMLILAHNSSHSSRLVLKRRCLKVQFGHEFSNTSWLPPLEQSQLALRKSDKIKINTTYNKSLFHLKRNATNSIDKDARIRTIVLS